MRMSERVGWSVWLCKQGSACACMCVCVCVCKHACMWLEDSVALVRMLDSPFAGSVASLVPSPPLPLTKWPRKGWSGIFGPNPWFSPSQIILANQILANQIAV